MVWGFGLDEKITFTTYNLTYVPTFKRFLLHAWLKTAVWNNQTYWSKLIMIGLLLVLSPSWNFPARAEPSRAEPSWSTSMFELKPSWIIFVIYSFFSSKHFFLGKKTNILRRKSIIHLKKIKSRVKMQGKTG